ncbi:Hsp33 family molecular chaperone HslO [bacterium]|nr:Hsp33 family molecular chaperone HslO [bacterium]
MPDTLIKATAADGRIRAVAAFTTETVNEACRRHATSPTASAALGKALGAGLLVASATMKDPRGSLTIRVMGDGPLGLILVDARANGAVRGYVSRPDTYLPPTPHGTLDVGGAVGRSGTLSITHDNGLGGQPYTGTVELVSGELGEDFTHYMATSMQTPSALSLGIFVQPSGEVEVSGGLLVQLMPDAGDEIAERLEETLSKLPSFTQLARQYGSLDKILHAALSGFAVEILHSEESVRFECPCSTDRVMRALASLGPTEIREIIEEQGQAEATCHFCNEQYVVSREQLEELLVNQ